MCFRHARVYSRYGSQQTRWGTWGPPTRSRSLANRHRSSTPISQMCLQTCPAIPRSLRYKGICCERLRKSNLRCSRRTRQSLAYPHICLHRRGCTAQIPLSTIALVGRAQLGSNQLREEVRAKQHLFCLFRGKTRSLFCLCLVAQCAFEALPGYLSLQRSNFRANPDPDRKKICPSPLLLWIVY